MPASAYTRIGCPKQDLTIELLTILLPAINRALTQSGYTYGVIANTDSKEGNQDGLERTALGTSQDTGR